jgi:pimeloyl-ACP methyl ester carboxylesterase
MKSLITTAMMVAFMTMPTGAAPEEEVFTFEGKGGAPVEAFRGKIMVPENRANPDSRMIPVSYVRFAGTGERKGPPIVYLAGGPGGSGIRTARDHRYPMFLTLRAYGDVIALDQRGTGASNILPKCVSSRVIPPAEPTSDADYIASNRAAFEECLAFWKAEGVDIAGYNTLENARDIDALRVALGAEKVVLWGTSYGSHLALAAMKEMGGHIDRMVISSAEGLDQTVKLPARTDAYFDRLQLAVDSQPAAKAAFGDVKALMRRVHAKLEAEPVLLHARMRDGSVKDYLFHRRDMQQLASYMISDPWMLQNLLSLYLAVDHGVTEPLEAVLGRMLVPGEPISMHAMSTLMDHASGMSGTRRGLVKAQAEEGVLGSWLNFSYHYDGLAPELDLGDSFRAGPVSDIPTLLLTGTLDGRTYVEGQAEAVAGLSRLTHVTVVNAGHNLFMSSNEVQEAINAFMEDKSQPRDEIMLQLPDLSPAQ